MSGQVQSHKGLRIPYCHQSITLPFDITGSPAVAKTDTTPALIMFLG